MAHSTNDGREANGKTVLLVEDNLHNRRIFAGILKHYGYQVVEATNGVEAIEVLNSTRPDIILMDLSLPVKDGWEATREIKDMPALRDIPIVALTAHAMDGDEEKARAVGCDGYLAKPISPKQLVIEVDRFLKGH